MSKVLIALYLILTIKIFLSSLRKKRIMMLVLSVFCLVYLGFRPVLLSLGVNATYAYVNPSLNQFEHDALFMAVTYQLLALLAICLGYSLRFNFKQRLIGNLRGAIDRGNSLAFFFLLAISLLIMLSPLRSTPWFYLPMSLVLLICARTIIDFGRSLYFKSFIFALSILFFVVFSEDRRDFLALTLVAFLASSLFYRISMLRISLATVLFGLFILYVSISLRTNGFFDLGAALERVSDYSQLQAVLEVETDFSIVYDDYILFWDSRFDYQHLYGVSFLKPLVSMVPRTIWESKPETSAVLFSQIFNPTFHYFGGTEPVTIFGELFWNFGWFSLVFFVLMGCGYRIIDKSFQTSVIERDGSTQAFYLVLSATSFHILRGPIDNFWFVHFFLILTVFLAVIIYRVPRRYPRPKVG